MLFHKVEDRLVFVVKYKLLLNLCGFFALSRVNMPCEDIDLGEGEAQAQHMHISAAHLAHVFIFKV